MVVIIFLIGAAQVADAPPLEALNPDDIPCYQIDDDGRIMDSDGRVRGWIKGDEIYSPAPGTQISYFRKALGGCPMRTK